MITTFEVREYRPNGIYICPTEFHSLDGAKEHAENSTQFYDDSDLPETYTQISEYDHTGICINTTYYK